MGWLALARGGADEDGTQAQVAFEECGGTGEAVAVEEGRVFALGSFF